MYEYVNRNTGRNFLTVFYSEIDITVKPVI